MNRDETWLLQEKYNGVETAQFQEDRTRLAQGEPLAYVIGSIPFCDAIIGLSTHPLIPRTETEFWVTELIATYRSDGRTPSHILDLCAGSGCIGIALGMAFPSTRITFCEIDSAHHPLIKQNALRNGITEDRITILGGDLFEEVRDSFDLIVSNPPYIDPALDRTEESVRQHEPRLALYGGNEGVEILENILHDVSSYLTTDGTLYLEHEPEQSSLLQQRAEDAGLVLHTHKDQYGFSRYSTARMAQ